MIVFFEHFPACYIVRSHEPNTCTSPCQSSETDGSCSISLIKAVFTLSSGDTCPLSALLQLHAVCSSRREKQCVGEVHNGQVYSDCVWSDEACHPHPLALESLMISQLDVSIPTIASGQVTNAQLECQGLSESKCNELCGTPISNQAAAGSDAAMDNDLKGASWSRSLLLPTLLMSVFFILF